MQQKTVTYLEDTKIIYLVDTIKRKRDRLLILLLYELGCTLSELLNIRVRDIDTQEKTIHITNASGSKRGSRTCMVSTSTIRLVLTFIQEEGIADKKTSYIFRSTHKKQMTLRRSTQIITDILEKAGIDIPNPQIIKYSHIINAYKKNVPVADIQKQVGLTKERIIAILLDIPTQDNDAYRRFLEDKE